MKEQVLRISLEERRAELIAEVRKTAPAVAEELESINSLIERYIRSEIADSSVPVIEVISDEWSDHKYPKPRHVIFAILKSNGGKALKTEIARIALEGGWKKGGKSPYYDILSAIDYFSGKTGRKKDAPLVQSDDGYVELVGDFDQ